MPTAGIRRLHIVLLALAAIALVVCIVSLDARLPNVPFSEVAFDGPICCDTDGTVSVVADSEGRRVLVLDANRRIVHVIEYGALDAPIDAVTDVCVSDGVVYVAGLRYQKDGNAIVQERVIAYTSYQAPANIVYDTGDERTYDPSIKALADGDDSAYAMVRVGQGGAGLAAQPVHFIRLDPQGSERVAVDDLRDTTIRKAGFDPGSRRYVTLSPRGVFDDDMGSDAEVRYPDRAFLDVDVTADAIVAADDISGDLCLIKGDEAELTVLMEGEGFESVHVNGTNVAACDFDLDLVVFGMLDGSWRTDLHAAKPSPLMSTHIVARWACRAYLLILVVGYGIHRIRLAFSTGNSAGLGGLFAAASVVVAVSLAIGYTAYDSYKTSLSTRAREISTLADILQNRSSDLSGSLDACQTRSVFRARGSAYQRAYDGLNEVAVAVSEIVWPANLNGIGVYFLVYAADDEGVFLVYDETMEGVIGTSPVSAATIPFVEHIFDNNESDARLHTGTSLRDDTQFGLVRIPSADGSSTAGVIEIGSRTRSFASAVITNLAESIVALLVVLFAVFLTYVEIRGCGHCFLEYRRLVEERARDAIAVLTRPYTFLVTMLSSIDAVMGVLIGRALLQESGMGMSGVLLALPTVTQGLGLMVGQAAYGPLGARVGVRRLVVSFSALLMLASIGAVISVGRDNFVLYCVAKFVLGIPFGLLYTLGYSLPRQAKSARVHSLATGGVRRTDTSAAAMGTILGGFVVYALGYQWVYVLLAAGAGLVVTMAVGLFRARGKKKLESDRGTHGHGLRATLQFLKRRETVTIVLLVLLPVTLCAGYNSFLFPLYSAELGVDAQTISNVFVLGQLVVYVAIDGVDLVNARCGKWGAAVGSLALLGAVMLVFSLNTKLVWAVVVIALVGVLCKAADGWKALWMRSAEMAGLPEGRATGTMFATRSVMNVVQPLLLGGLLSISSSVATIALGIIALACVTVFVVLTYKSELNRRHA